MTPLEALKFDAAVILGRSLTETQAAMFSKYLDILIKWRKNHRLIGSDDENWIVQNVFLDSLVFLRVLTSTPHELADFGAGAGIPGIPLAIVLQGTRVTLIESRQRRVSFLSTVVRELGLRDIEIMHLRLQSGRVPAELERRFDAVVMRCAGDPTDVMPLALELTKTGGLVVASGPPADRPLKWGQWVTVEGVSRGTTRRFAVAPKS